MRKNTSLLTAVAYDIADDRRRRRVFKTLKNFGRPVQYSAFECILDNQQFNQLRQILTRLTQVEEDGLAYYLLCKECAERTIVLCGPPRLTLPRVVVV